mgnify:CR=1 FL=1
MGADQIAAIHPAIRELHDAIRADASSSRSLCLTISVASHESAWVQVVGDCVNFGYPSSENPIVLLERAGLTMPPGVSLDDWQPGTFATLSGDFGSDAQISAFIDRLLIAVHGLDSQDYSVDLQFENL